MRKPIDCDTLRQQAVNHSKQRFAASPDLNSELLNAIMGALDADTAMSTQAVETARGYNRRVPPPSEAREQKASRIFGRVFLTLTRVWGDVYSFRRVVELGLPHAHREVSVEKPRVVMRLVEDLARDQVFSDTEKFLATAGGVEGIARAMTVREMTAFRGSVDAASLVFMHSALDAAAQDLCRVTALVGPAEWRQFVDTRSIHLAQAREKGYEALADEKVEDLLRKLSRLSLIKKVDKLFQVCRPDPSYSRANYQFDRHRLIDLDHKRHSLVHGELQREPIPDIEGSVDYLLETGLYLFGMVNHRYGVRVEPGAVFRL